MLSINISCQQIHQEKVLSIFKISIQLYSPSQVPDLYLSLNYYFNQQRWLVVPHLTPQVISQWPHFLQNIFLLRVWSQAISGYEIIIPPNIISQWWPIFIPEFSPLWYKSYYKPTSVSLDIWCTSTPSKNQAIITTYIWIKSYHYLTYNPLSI